MGAEAEDRGEGQAALEYYRESLSLLIDDRYDAYVVHPLAGMASRAAAAEQMDLAARLVGAVAFLHETLGTVVWSHERTRDERSEALARAALGEGRFQPGVRGGQTPLGHRGGAPRPRRGPSRAQGQAGWIVACLRCARSQYVSDSLVQGQSAAIMSTTSTAKGKMICSGPRCSEYGCG